MMIFKIYKDKDEFYFTGEEGDLLIGLAGIPSLEYALIKIGSEINRRNIREAQIYHDHKLVADVSWVQMD